MANIAVAQKTPAKIHAMLPTGKLDLALADLMGSISTVMQETPKGEPVHDTLRENVIVRLDNVIEELARKRASITVLHPSRVFEAIVDVGHTFC